MNLNINTRNKAKLRCCVVILATVVALIVGGCSRDTVTSELGASRIVPSVEVNPTIKGPDGTMVDAHRYGIVPEASALTLTLKSMGGEFESSWPSVADYPVDQNLKPGTYRIDAADGLPTDEGLGRAAFGASEDITLAAGQEKNVKLEARMLNSAVEVVYGDGFRRLFPEARAVFHCSGGAYLAVPTDNGRILSLRPGKMTVILEGIEHEGRKISTCFATVANLEACSLCRIEIDAEPGAVPVITGKLHYAGDVTEARLNIDGTLMDSQAPAVECRGFESGEAITNIEGTHTGRQLAVSVNGAETVMMTTKASFVAGTLESQWPAEVDLMAPGAEIEAILADGGIAIQRGPDGSMNIDLTNLAWRLSSATPHASFSFMAISSTGKTTGPVTLDIDVEKARVEIVEVSEAVIGSDMGELVIASDSDNLGDNLAIYGSNDGVEWHDCGIISVIPVAGTDRSRVAFSLPTTSSNEVKLKVEYCGHPVGEATMQVVAPSFTIDVDAFALSAMIKVNGESESMTRLITSRATVMADGRQCHVISRDVERGIITVGDLKPSTSYTFTATVADDATEADLTPAVKATTEAAATIANPGFEDIKYHALKYKGMPSGGRYSQTIVEIYNQQNYTSFDLNVPEKWATTNAKTFCLKAKNINTWYVQPSVYTVDDCAGGNFAVKLQSVAWDVAGPGIPNWRQPGQPYVDYSREVPQIAHRAAAKIFIGSYSFDASNLDERYSAGASFESRPSAINGYYKYVPSQSDPSDRGKVEVEIRGELDGKPAVIASGTLLLGAALDYTTFTVPLVYNHFGVKATSISIIISSSEDTGSIEYESSKVSTWDDVRYSRSLGSALWVDELTLSY